MDQGFVLLDAEGMGRVASRRCIVPYSFLEFSMLGLQRRKDTRITSGVLRYLICSCRDFTRLTI
jgi:hypothetical protein